MNFFDLRGCSGRCLRLLILSGMVGAGASGFAQRVGTGVDAGVQPEISSISLSALPAAPEPQRKTAPDEPLMTAGPAASVTPTAQMPMVPMYSMIVPAGMAAPQIHGRDKYIMAARNLYSLTSLEAIVASAGWGQLVNGQPNYGTNSEAFGQRVGAAAVRDSAQAFLSDGPFAVWLHQDPRYFALGPQHSVARRTWYAATRALITRDSTDGHAVLNTSLILGQAAGTALNNLYYPQSNRNVHDNLASFGGSMGGAALSFVLDEFSSQVLKAIHLKHEGTAR